MSKKSTGLAAFSRKLNEIRTQAPPAPPRPRGRSRPATAKPTPTVAKGAPKPRGRPSPEAAASKARGGGETVSLTVRIARGDWARLHQLAVEEGTSIQQLAIRGLSEVFEGKGLPRLAAVASTYRK